MRYNRAHHDLGIGVGNMAAMAAHIAFHRVAVRNATHKMRAAAGRYRKFIVRHSLNLPHATGQRKRQKKIQPANASKLLSRTVRLSKVSWAFQLRPARRDAGSVLHHWRV
jgi:hypothetical protein